MIQSILLVDWQIQSRRQQLANPVRQEQVVSTYWGDLYAMRIWRVWPKLHNLRECEIGAIRAHKQSRVGITRICLEAASRAGCKCRGKARTPDIYARFTQGNINTIRIVFNFRITLLAVRFYTSG